ncbi:hypothetical protein M440DRAFT_157535 [Trichoderma longibrachiatum ATCC 18648]|uniref:Uncharacterized protein n=1 Tax=Trichoderma longibrachiatum ATCC 18648 TaxID=983965 RepID=A0A2T4BT27_TRILO|nr:hypothetical protein M440DRAFT_157535 [Trichoderma longibrachiatum ATCC 18648]
MNCFAVTVTVPVTRCVFIRLHSSMAGLLASAYPSTCHEGVPTSRISSCVRIEQSVSHHGVSLQVCCYMPQAHHSR